MKSIQTPKSLKSASIPFQIFKISSILLFFISQAYLTLRLIKFIPIHINSFLTYIATILTIAFSYLLSDFISGLVHFLCDNFGSEKTPLVGKPFIQPFRVHHDDPLDITRHGFIATNANNCFILLPVLLPLSIFLPMQNIFLYFFALLFWGFSWGIFATNQIHKWAHQPNPPKSVKFLQNHKLILHPTHHQIHHTPPFNKYYCITTGWLNPLIQKTKICERLTKRN